MEAPSLASAMIATSPAEVRACREAVAVSGRAPDYLFGQSAEEAGRLRLQARMFAPYTARFLEDAGVLLRGDVLRRQKAEQRGGAPVCQVHASVH
jgi:hypothetical protein